MKLLSGILLTLTLATASTSASAITISKTLGDLLGNTDTTRDSGGQGIRFTDVDGSSDDDATFMLRLETAGNPDSNSMGLYIYNRDTEQKQTFGSDGLFEVFSGTDSYLDITNLNFDFSNNTITREKSNLLDGQVTSSEVFGGSTTVGTNNYTSDLFSTLSTLSLSGLEIGVYLQNNIGDTFYSHNNLNANGKRMVGIYETNTGLTFGFEDRINGDDDYSDMVVNANDVALVPEPTSLAIFGLGLLGLAGAARRRNA